MRSGNLMSDGSHSYIYDAEGNVTAVDGGSTAKYTYNALNERVRIDLGGSSSEEFIFNPFGNHTSAHDAIHNWAWADWIYWGDSSARVAVDTDSQTNFDHQDWEGTERAVTLYNGSVEGTYTSLPFGDGYSVSGSDIDPYHFAMLDHDSTSSTDHAQFRQYGNTQGRWMSPDPYSGSYDVNNPQSMNRYSYALNSPLSFVDPSGLEVVDCPPGTPDGTICVDTWGDGGDGGGDGGDGGGSGGGPAGPSKGPGGPGGQGPHKGKAPKSLNCAGTTTLVNGNIRIQANAAGTITSVGFPLTDANGYQTTTGSGVNFQIPPSTIMAVSLNSDGSLSVAVNNSIYVAHSGSFFGGYVSSVTFSKGTFTQVNGSISFLGMHGSTSTPSTPLQNILNSNSGLINAAQLLQNTAKMVQGIFSCKVGG